MGFKESLRTLLGSKPPLVEQINSTAIDFVCRPSVEAMIGHLKDELKGLKADKVVVVSGFKLESLSGDQFPRYEYIHNSWGYFGWLLKICEYMRESRRPQILVSRFPRHWNPPKIKVVQASFDPNIFGTADGSLGGTVYEVSASAGSQFMNNPSRITLNVIADEDRVSTLAIYFLGLYATTYYREVLASQGCPPRQPLVCKVISGLDDPAVETAARERLRLTDDPRQEAAILRKESDKLEELCTASARAREKGAYNGGVLLPKFPQNEQLPPGARSTKTEQRVLRGGSRAASSSNSKFSGPEYAVQNYDLRSEDYKRMEEEVAKGNASGSETLDSLCEELVVIVQESHDWALANKFPPVADYPNFQRIRSLGEEIYAVAGFQGMQRACMVLKSRCHTRDGGAKSWPAEAAWHGIGGWMP